MRRDAFIVTIHLAMGLLASGCSSDPDGGTLGTSGGGAAASAGAGAGTSGSGASSSAQGSGGAGATGPGELVFFDDFEYQVERDAVGDSFIFLEHGWGWVKTETDDGGAGYLYTVEGIDGFDGTFPGAGSTRVLALEARPTMYPPPPDFPYSQTDFYLQYGVENGPLDTIPADVWIQFWIYVADTENQPSRFPTRNKFLYPSASVDPPYPSHDERWMFMNGSQGFEAEAADPEDNFLCMRPPRALRSGTDPVDANKLGQNLDLKQVLANDWYLIRIHVDISQPEGRWEAWIRAQNEPALTKIAEWIGGETPDFTWPLPPEERSGPRTLRIPTTVNEFDSWMYMDDFAIATGESALPTY
jgi:hypothetical protein